MLGSLAGLQMVEVPFLPPRPVINGASVLAGYSTATIRSEVLDYPIPDLFLVDLSEMPPLSHRMN